MPKHRDFPDSKFLVKKLAQPGGLQGAAAPPEPLDNVGRWRMVENIGENQRGNSS